VGGLQDEQQMLKFLQKHLASFGGGPDAVTLAGRSADAQSTGIHYFHNYGEARGESLFHRAIFQSGSVTAGAFPTLTIRSEYRKYFERYMLHLDSLI
jgi:carboxylesterase type B